MRFSKLFRPIHVPHIWKRKKKRKPEEEDPKISDNKKSSESKPDANIKNEPEATSPDDRYNEEALEDEGAVTSDSVPTKEEDDDYPTYRLNLGRPARPEELMRDDTVSQITEIYFMWCWLKMGVLL